MIRTRTIGVALMALVGLSGFNPAPRAADLAGQGERQKLIRAETDRLVHRVQTMIRVLEYNRLDRSAEKQLLDQVAGTLAGLSREQMVRLIDALERAGKVDGAERTRELLEAQERHEQIVLGLKGLLARFDAIKSLDQAAERLDKMARDELDHYLQNVQLTWEDEDQKNPQANQEYRLRAERLAGEEGFLHRDLSNLLTQASELRKLLPPEQQQRLSKLEAAAQSSNLFAKLMTASRQLRAAGAPVERHQSWRRAAETQWHASGDIQELARILHGPADKLASLRESRQMVDRLLDEQEGVRQGTRTPPEKAKPDATPEEIPDLNLRWARELINRQTTLEFDARAARALLHPHAPELASKLKPIEKTMREVQSALRNQVKRRPPVDQAAAPQDTALEKLREVKKELDQLIAEAEKAQADPLANLKDTLAQVEQILKEQKDVRDKADEAGKTEQAKRLPYLAPKQEKLAARTAELPNQPTAAAPQTKKALDDAAKAMDQAAKTLQEKQAAPSVEKQDQALTDLEEAKKALAEQVAEIEKRREDIAKLEEAEQRLDKMIQEESKIAEDAKDKATKEETKDKPKKEEAKDKAKKPEKDDAKDLANKQGELTPQAKELGKELEKSAPEAGKQVQDGAKQMEAAKENLDKKQLPPAAKNADKAAEKLKEAKKAVAKALDEKRGKEAAEQAAMHKEVDSANASQQIAKALEQTEKAAKNSEKAAEQLANKAQAQQPDLVKLQKEVAERAEDVEAPAAKQPANEAAEALQKGELREAVTRQERALAQLRDAARKMGQPIESSPQGMPKPAEAKDAGELAQAQKALLEATKALTRSQDAKQDQDAQARGKPQANNTGQPQTPKTGQQPNQTGEKQQQKEEEEAKPDLVKLQKDVAMRAEKVEAPKAQQPADEAADALQKGDLTEAVTRQTQALAQLRDVAQKKGQSTEASLQGAPMPADAKNAGELAQAQKALLEATKALAQSQAANQAAMAALAQAQAQAPGIVQPQLNMAGQQLAKAGQKLPRGQAKSANQAQGQAAAQLKQAMDALNSAMAQGGEKGEGQQQGQQKGENQAQKPSQEEGKGQGQKPGQEQGKEPAQGQGKGQQPGRGLEKNERRGGGYRVADGQMNNGPAHLRDVRGEGMFIHLPPRQRELIKQALSDKLPPEYAALIQQYYVNIAKGKPAMKTPEKPKP